jgi:diguanylate cyclase (GGDEF)-like protein
MLVTAALVVHLLVASTGSALLVACWWRARSEPALLWWAAALVMGFLATVPVAAGIAWSLPALAMTGSALGVLAAAAFWTGACVFHGRRAPVEAPIFAMLGWLVAILLAPGKMAAAAVAAGAALGALFSAASGVELWRARAQRLPIRWAAASAQILQALVLAGLSVVVIFNPALIESALQTAPWFGVLYAGLIVAMAMFAVSAVLLLRQRLTRFPAATHAVDPLTGTATREAFMLRAEEMLRRAGAEGSSVALIGFALDDLHTINSTYGRAAGDRALVAVAHTATRMLRSVDIIGRVRSDEFWVLLIGTGSDAGYVVAERIRHAIAITPVFVMNFIVTLSVSAGIASSDGTSSLAGLMGEVDRALARARSQGRNRVERADQIPEPRKAAAAAS